MCILGKQTTLISCLLPLLCRSVFSALLPNLSHTFMFICFVCDLPRLTKAMYVTMKLPVGAWWLSRGQKTKDSGSPSHRIY